MVIGPFNSRLLLSVYNINLKVLYIFITVYIDCMTAELRAYLYYKINVIMDSFHVLCFFLLLCTPNRQDCHFLTISLFPFQSKILLQSDALNLDSERHMSRLVLLIP